MSDDHLVKKQALLDNTKKSKPMVLVKNWKFYLCLFIDRIGLEIIFDDQ